MSKVMRVVDGDAHQIDPCGQSHVPGRLVRWVNEIAQRTDRRMTALYLEEARRQNKPGFGLSPRMSQGSGCIGLAAGPGGAPVVGGWRR
jgi:hypothetical protein